MENIVIKKITTILKFYSLSLVVILLISACNLVTVDEAEDSGFDFRINNYSDKEYNNCIIYMGYKDKDNNFYHIKNNSVFTGLKLPLNNSNKSLFSKNNYIK